MSVLVLPSKIPVFPGRHFLFHHDGDFLLYDLRLCRLCLNGRGYSQMLCFSGFPFQRLRFSVKHLIAVPGCVSFFFNTVADDRYQFISVVRSVHIQKQHGQFFVFAVQHDFSGTVRILLPYAILKGILYLAGAVGILCRSLHRHRNCLFSFNNPIGGGIAFIYRRLFIDRFHDLLFRGADKLHRIIWHSNRG